MLFSAPVTARWHRNKYSSKKFGLRLHIHSLNATGRTNETIKDIRDCGPDEVRLTEKEVYAELSSDSQGIHVHPDMQ